MGWTGIDRYSLNTFGQPTRKDKQKYLDYLFSGDDTTVLKSSMNGTVYYAAVKSISNNCTFAVVTLTQMDREWFYYKDLDETEGPCQVACPKSIMKLLSPTNNEFALDWRKRVDKYHEDEKKKRFLNDMKPGTTISIKSPYDTTAYRKGETVYLTKQLSFYKMKTVWMSDRNYIWSKKMIPADYEVINR